jgi:hypothetical protein
MSWLAHPLIVSVLAPILLGIIFAAATVWATQGDVLHRLNSVETDAKTEQRARESQVNEIKSQIVPRSEHEARWKSIDDKLDVIQRQGGVTSQRIDDIYKILTTRDRK